MPVYLEDDQELREADREKFCWNCLHFDKGQNEKPCDSCYGIDSKKNKYFAYRNWERGFD